MKRSSAFLIRADPGLGLFFTFLPIPSCPQKISIAVSPGMPGLLSVVNEVVRYNKTDSTQQFFAEYGPLIKSVVGSPSGRSGHGKTRRVAVGEAAGVPLPALAAVGLPLAVFVFLWLRLPGRWAHAGGRGRA